MNKNKIPGKIVHNNTAIVVYIQIEVTIDERSIQPEEGL
jgi:hypothetical protein